MFEDDWWKWTRYGQMEMPFVLQSDEVMKTAVA